MVYITPRYLAPALSLFSLLYATNAAPDPNLLRVLGPQGVNLWRLEKAAQAAKVSKESSFVLQESEGTQGVRATTEFRERWFEQPLDHFDKGSKHTFKQRYWVNDRHYEAGGGGPVVVLDGGETSGEGRLPFLDTGIVDILTKATGGVGVVLEHRYYGASIPVENFTTDSLRWLDNEQSAADSANFMASVKFDGIDEDLTAPNTPWIYYGGSYAGARAAHMKVLYPELTYGAIASSAVVNAAISNWEYMDVIRKAADPICSAHLVNSIAAIDKLLDHRVSSGPIKALFGAKGLQHDEDFVSLLESPLGSWQSKVWDPAVGSTRFDNFCAALNKPLGHGNASLTDLPFNHPSRMVAVDGGIKVDLSVFNYAKYIKENIVSRCPADRTLEDCFGTFDDAQYQGTSLDEDWRLWQFQVCTQWGYFTTAPPDPTYPRIISRRITLEYESKICRQAYPPGKHFTVPAWPNITAVNALGDFDLAADHLAFIDGEVDPWRPNTPHSEEYAKDREDTLLRPFKLIPGGVHHWDEWGLANIADEPFEIRKIHGEMIAFVMEWLKDWEAPRKN